MKLTFDLANKYQKTCGLSVDTAEFLHLEGVNRQAMRFAMESKLETLGSNSPVIPHVNSLLRDYGRPLIAEERLGSWERSERGFEDLLKSLFEAMIRRNHDDAQAFADALIKLVGPITLCKAFQRLRDNNATGLCSDDADTVPIEWQEVTA
jgi:hypothetical protein